MNPSPELDAHRVTKPIQLLAAWLVGLISIEGAFLTAAKLVITPTWAPVLLVTAAVLYVPLFLVFIFLLQTRFRPQMQEDAFYAKYLEKQLGPNDVETASAEISVVKDQLMDANARILEFIETFQSQIKNLRKTVLEEEHTYKAAAPAAFRELKSQLDHAEEYLTSAERAEQWEAQRTADWSEVTISVNERLSNQREIREYLSAAGLNLVSSFGGEKPPSRFIVSVGPEVPVENAQQIIRLLADFNVEGVRLASAFGNEIIIGSYGSRSGFAKFTEESLAAFLDPNLAVEQFQQLILAKTEVNLGND